MTGTKILHLWFEVNIEIISNIVIGTQQTFRDHVLYNCLLLLYNIMCFSWELDIKGRREYVTFLCLTKSALSTFLVRKCFLMLNFNLNTPLNYLIKYQKALAHIYRSSEHCHTCTRVRKFLLQNFSAVDRQVEEIALCLPAPVFVFHLDGTYYVQSFLADGVQQTVHEQQTYFIVDLPLQFYRISPNNCQGKLLISCTVWNR